MHYFKSLGYAVNLDDIWDIHIGTTPPTFSWLGNYKSNGVINIKITFTNQFSKEITIEGLNHKNFLTLSNDIQTEVSNLYNTKEPKIAKEDPTENVIKEAS